jgi:hypothetical protein
LANAVTAQGKAAGDAWAALMRDKSLQFQFPDAAPNAKPPTWLTRLLEFLAHHGREISWLGWAAVAVVVLVALWFLIVWARGRGLTVASSPAARPMAPWQPSARQARLLLKDADALAAQGRFDAAVHLLLLVSIQEIAERQQGTVTPALTSREIASLPALSVLAQRIFSAIAQVVEVSRFGNRAIGEPEYRLCRSAFEKFAAADTWRVAA